MLLTIRAANRENAEVKSPQDRGSFSVRLVNSTISMKMVTQKQKHQENMHHVQKGSKVWPTDATKLKVTHVKTTSRILTMPTRSVSALKSRETILIEILWSV